MAHKHKCSPKFKVGNDVRWTSQAGGVSKTKRGEIVARVPALVSPYVIGYFKGLNAEGRRDHDSYIVLAKNGRHYWPRVSALKKD